MQETFEQKVIRNIQGKFSVYKTPEVIGEQTGIPNIEWSDSENVDAFFKFAAHLGAKVVYLTEGEEEDEQTQAVKKTIVQVGFLHQGIMHHINFADEDEDDEEDYDEDGEEYEDEEDVYVAEEEQPAQSPQNFGM